MSSAEKSLRRLSLRLHHLILRRRLFHLVFLIGISSFLIGGAILLLADQTLGGTIIKWGMGCTFPLLLLMVLLMWGTTAAHSLAGRRYVVFAFMAFVSACVTGFLYLTLRVFLHMLFAA